MATFSATYLSSSSFTISGDVTAYFPTGVRCRVDCSGWVYVTVSTSSYSSPNTTVTTEETTLTDPCGNVEVSVVHPDGVAIHDHSDNSGGGDGITGLPPEHEWDGTKIRFKNPNGTWGSYVELSGDAKTKQLAQTAGEALSEGNIVYKKSADSEWYIAQNDGTEAEADSWGVVSESGGIASGETGEITIFGLVGSGGVTLTDGTPVYLDAAGLPTSTPPATTAYWKHIGYATATDEYIFIPPKRFDPNILIRGGSEELDGDKIDIDVTFDSITPDTSPGEVDNAAHLGAILKGIENFIENGIPIKITGTAGEALSQYDLVYSDTSDSGEWKKADSDIISKAAAAGIVLESGGIANGSTGSILRWGTVTNGAWSFTRGSLLYPSSTAGGLSETRGTYGYVIGQVDSESADTIFFNPQLGSVS